jgi:hypothetical protein
MKARTIKTITRAAVNTTILLSSLLKYGYSAVVAGLYTLVLGGATGFTIAGEAEAAAGAGALEELATAAAVLG